MKSPWRFLADLTSRRKPDVEQLRLPAADAASDDHAIAPNNVSEPELPVAQPPIDGAAVTELELVSFEPEVAPIAERTEPAPEPLDTQETLAALDPSEGPSVAETPVGIADAAPVKKSRTQQPKRVKEGPGPAAVQAVPEKSEPEQTPAVPAQPLTFHDEVSGLDGEIAALKAALAQKLKLQNAQLKKMLARFDVS